MLAELFSAPSAKRPRNSHCATISLQTTNLKLHPNRASEHKSLEEQDKAMAELRGILVMLPEHYLEDDRLEIAVFSWAPRGFLDVFQ